MMNYVSNKGLFSKLTPKKIDQYYQFPFPIRQFHSIQAKRSETKELAQMFFLNDSEPKLIGIFTITQGVFVSRYYKYLNSPSLFVPEPLQSSK
ncbi:hypothetical protein MTR_7g074000 [Medicago truncatula]|uniref:Uncharacterized protein n=1 Tax=Medicago truncatula TaxID=3880 RepID=G7KY74_MEDTR|nr:hypothetical protein MTR_7g074000 [Medicago truncatula]